mmetsp:Transcript_28417/g.62475  ORF Transcript_28417/g.62475 Transcript_28417/m.62475 type:complete len:224 (+) Transcript_28417:237-908(+)
MISERASAMSCSICCCVCLACCAGAAPDMKYSRAVITCGSTLEANQGWAITSAARRRRAGSGYSIPLSSSTSWGLSASCCASSWMFPVTELFIMTPITNRMLWALLAASSSAVGMKGWPPNMSSKRSTPDAQTSSACPSYAWLSLDVSSSGAMATALMVDLVRGWVSRSCTLEMVQPPSLACSWPPGRCWIRMLGVRTSRCVILCACANASALTTWPKILAAC